MRLLLSTGIADVTLQNDNGHDALMEAASSGNVDVVKMLVDAGARPNFVNMHSEFKVSNFFSKLKISRNRRLPWLLIKATLTL